MRDDDMTDAEMDANADTLAARDDHYPDDDGSDAAAGFPARAAGNGSPIQGNPMRDNGPFLDADQAHAQFSAATHGLPGVRSGSSLGSQLVIGEALMMTGALPSGYESDEMVRVCVDLPPETVQVIAGWVIRAWLAGRSA